MLDQMAYGPSARRLPPLDTAVDICARLHCTVQHHPSQHYAQLSNGDIPTPLEPQTAASGPDSGRKTSSTSSGVGDLFDTFIHTSRMTSMEPQSSDASRKNSNLPVNLPGISKVLAVRTPPSDDDEAASALLMLRNRRPSPPRACPPESSNSSPYAKAERQLPLPLQPEPASAHRTSFSQAHLGYPFAPQMGSTRAQVTPGSSIVFPQSAGQPEKGRFPVFPPEYRSGLEPIKAPKSPGPAQCAALMPLPIDSRKRARSSDRTIEAEDQDLQEPPAKKQWGTCQHCDNCEEKRFFRSAVSHIFGRNKQVTKLIPASFMPEQCRKSYQRAKYAADNKGGKYYQVQATACLKVVERLRDWWSGVLRQREALTWTVTMTTEVLGHPANKPVETEIERRLMAAGFYGKGLDSDKVHAAITLLAETIIPEIVAHFVIPASVGDRARRQALAWIAKPSLSHIEFLPHGLEEAKKRGVNLDLGR